MAGVIKAFFTKVDKDNDEKKKAAEKVKKIRYIASNAIPNYLTKKYMDAGGDAPQGGGSIRAFNKWLRDNEYNIQVRD